MTPKNMANPRVKRILLASGILVAVAAGVVANTHFQKEREMLVKKEEEKKALAKKSSKKKRSPKFNAAQLNKKLDEMTEGKQVKAVWVESLGQKTPDPHAKSDDLRLVGFDNQDDGYRIIRENKENYARPLITPDGHLIIYTDKGTKGSGTELTFSPQIHLVDWEGEHDEVLMPGFCVDVAKDPQTGKTMVYALETLNPKTQPTLDGERLFRFPLDQPQKKEMLWDKTSLSVDNLQFSRDGKIFSGLFPWPEGGIGDVTTGTWRKSFNGCWSSMAPDNSYLTWIFAGSHNKVRFDDTRRNKKWEVKINNAPGLDGAQVYHPRWSNHPLFFSMTGPYGSKSKKSGEKTKQAAPMVAAGSAAEVYIGRFSPSLDRVEAWAKLSSNTYGDFQPDVWIEGGDDAVLAQFEQTGGSKIEPPPTTQWPGSSANLVYVWRNSDAMNVLDGRHMNCNVLAHGTARFGRAKDMLLDGGWFETDSATAEATAKELAQSKAITFEFLFTEEGMLKDGESSTLCSLKTADGKSLVEIKRAKDSLIASMPESAFAAKAGDFSTALPFAPNTTLHVVLEVNETGGQWSVDGKQLPAKNGLSLSMAGLAGAKLEFGQTTPVPAGWSARLSNVAVFKRALTDREIATHSKVSRPEPVAPTTRIKVLAKLVEATTPDPTQLGSYKRMLVDHTYEVVKVLEGTLAAPKINVMEWGMLDMKLVPGIPRDLDKEYELTLEPADAHPEITSELQMATSTDLEAPQFLNVSPPLPVGL